MKEGRPLKSSEVQLAYNDQYLNYNREWRELCAKYKAINIFDVSKTVKEGGFKKVLEIGAGDGSLLHFLDKANFGAELYALEISTSGVAVIKNRNLTKLKSVQQFDGYQIPFDDNFFDLVILSHVLEHVEFPRLLLREMKRVSQHQIIEVPCDFSTHVDKKVDYFLSHGHINIYIPVLLRFLLMSEGFVVLGDKMTMMKMDVLKYNLFINQKHKKSVLFIVRLYLFYFLRRIIFSILPKFLKEKKGSAYTILCLKGKRELTILT